MSYIKYGFTLTDGQKQSLAGAYNKREGHTLRLNLSQLSGNNILGITKTQYNKVMKAKAEGRNIELKLSATQLSKNGGALGSIVSKILPMAMKYGPKLLGTLGLSALSGAVSGATHKAVRGSGVKSGGILLGLLKNIFGFGINSPNDLTPEQVLSLRKLQ